MYLLMETSKKDPTNTNMIGSICFIHRSGELGLVCSICSSPKKYQIQTLYRMISWTFYLYILFMTSSAPDIAMTSWALYFYIPFMTSSTPYIGMMSKTFYFYTLSMTLSTPNTSRRHGHSIFTFSA